MNFEDWRRRADAVRSTPLEEVLALCSAAQDRRDRRKWHTSVGPLSITGTQFYNWSQDVGGGGAIDLTMHLLEVDVVGAVAWLERHVGSSWQPNASCDPAPQRHTSDRALLLPRRDDSQWPRVWSYLTGRRSLPAPAVLALTQSGRLYADVRGNAVFLLTWGRPERAVGAELRGTGVVRWRGMAEGSDKQAGCFWTGREGSRQIILCESAIDAISCSVFYPDVVSLSTSGVCVDRRWLSVLLDSGYEVLCGFDTDASGERCAAAIARKWDVRRVRPAAHDWNEALLQMR